MFFKKKTVQTQRIINETFLLILTELETRLSELEEVLDEVIVDVEGILESFEE